MPRAALKPFLAAVLLGLAVPAPGLDPHLDPSLMRASCAACHLGHGASRSPMLPGSQAQVCLSCHGTQADLAQQVLRDTVAAGAAPPLLSSVLSKPFRHRLDGQAFSNREAGAVTCTSCHSPHRAMPESISGPLGRQRLAPNNPGRLEFELCESCHGGRGGSLQATVDVGRLLDPVNRSFHPVEAAAAERSPSVLPHLSGREINCTDCHNNNDRSGPRGPHGSSLPFILSAEYVTIDGLAESLSAYALCYSCHERAQVLEDSAFPEHGSHVVEARITCASCHDAHGSPRLRALIRFSAARNVVTASMSTGRLDFISEVAGTGTCHLTCHGHDHGPETYGLGEGETLAADSLLLRLPESAVPGLPRLPGERPKPRRPKQKRQ